MGHVPAAIAAFPPACFSSFIAANSFKTTLPKVNPFISSHRHGRQRGTGGDRAGGQSGRRVRHHRGQFPVRFAARCSRITSSTRANGPGRAPGLIPPAGSRGRSFRRRHFAESPRLEPVNSRCSRRALAAFVVGAVVYFLCVKMGLQSAVVPMREKLTLNAVGGIAGWLSAFAPASFYHLKCRLGLT